VLLRLGVDQNSYIHSEYDLDYDCAGLAPAVDIGRTPSFVLYCPRRFVSPGSCMCKAGDRRMCGASREMSDRN
jgi:hypothetical protein